MCLKMKRTEKNMELIKFLSVYFGDDNDDIEPIKNCGIGVAVKTQ